MIKHVHREPRQARDTKGSLEAYNIDALSNRGALLFSIIGGKMSEGINFADDLAFRHADDYAAVILADYRYSSDLSVWNKLPNWLRNSREISRQHSYSKAVD
jgi:Rad3-related DNA helicase